MGGRGDDPRRGRRCGARAGSASPLCLEALTAEHGAALGRLEGNGRLDAALRAAGTRLRARQAGRCRTAARARSGANPGTLRLAGLAAFGVVLELLVKEEELFPGGED